VAINPEGQVPVLDHDGTIVTHTTVINEYLEDAFPDAQPADGPLRPRDPVGAARMRYWNKFVDEHVMNHVSMHGWHRMVGIIARNIESGEFEKLLENIPLPDQRKKWATARSGFSEADLAHAMDKIAYAVDKVERQLGETAWLAGDVYTLADINFYAHCGMMVERMFPELEIARAPRLVAWRDRMTARPAVAAALAGRIAPHQACAPGPGTRAEGGSEKMAGFVLIHGSWHGGWCFDKLAAILEARGHTVVAPTLPGMGGTEAEMAAVTLEDWGDFAAQHCRDLQARLGGAPVVLGGTAAAAWW
jgi:glutathione S-transferase